MIHLNELVPRILRDIDDGVLALDLHGPCKKYDKNYHKARRIETCGGFKLCLDSKSDKQFEKKENKDMSNSKNSNRLVVPGAREAMDKFKMEAANEVGVNLKQGYNGDLTSRQAGSVGGQMVKKMIEAYENGLK